MKQGKKLMLDFWLSDFISSFHPETWSDHFRFVTRDQPHFHFNWNRSRVANVFQSDVLSLLTTFKYLMKVDILLIFTVPFSSKGNYKNQSLFTIGRNIFGQRHHRNACVNRHFCYYDGEFRSHLQFSLNVEDCKATS